jgi:phosphatidylglycerophosphate synthase
MRSLMRQIARLLNRLSGGRLSPNMVTIGNFVIHIGIAWLIATQHYLLAGALLFFFGLFDAVDGELARLQHKDSNAGMVLDASMDRAKEVLLYSGAAWAFVATGHPYASVWAVVACGASMMVSYVKAKGETAIAKSHLSVTEINKLFAEGLMRFEIRMLTLVIGLVINQLMWAVILIALSSAITAFWRLIRITRRLSA